MRRPELLIAAVLGVAACAGSGAASGASPSASDAGGAAPVGDGAASGDAGASGAGGAAGLEEGELLPGGATTTSGAAAGAFTLAAANLTLARRGDFEAGLQFFQLAWVAAPGRPEADGLGPVFNAASCLDCHVANGRGELATVLLRIGLGPANLPDPVYGSQLQPFGLAGVPGEAAVARTERVVAHPRADGTVASLFREEFAPTALAYGPTGADLRISPRIAPALVGQGLLESIAEADIVAGEDPDDADGDGISGRVRWVGDPAGTRQVGRFGWKAGQPSVLAQTAAAFAEDLGITSPLHPDGPCTAAETACRAAPDGGSPELTATRLAVTAAYVRLLGVPARREGTEPDVLAGKALFAALGCAGCHRPSSVTTAQASEPELAGQRVWPYSDLLLHDLGPDLADGRTEGDAGPTEWRTAPLWGLGLVPVTAGSRRLLHDGRARDVDEAILWHGGEATRARVAYERLTPDERVRVARFVLSL